MLQNTLLLSGPAEIISSVAFKSQTCEGSEGTRRHTREVETTEAFGRRNCNQREQQQLVAKRRGGQDLGLVTGEGS